MLEQQTRNTLSFYTEFGINKTIDLLTSANLNLNSILSITSLLCLATNQTNEITRYSAQLIIDKYLKIQSLVNQIPTGLAVSLITVTENIRTGICDAINTNKPLDRDFERTSYPTVNFNSDPYYYWNNDYNFMSSYQNESDSQINLNMNKQRQTSLVY